MVRKGGTVGNVSSYEQHSDTEDDDAVMASTSSESTPLLANMASNEAMEGQKLNQYLGALAACVSAMAAGTTMGWTSAAERTLTNKDKDFHLDEEEFSWAGAFLAIGAFVAVVPLGTLANVLGRKKLLICLSPIMLAGWILLACANNVWMVYGGRMILGAVTGTFCVVAPMYTGEIAENSIRGVLGSFFQLLITAGILFVYALDALGVELLPITIACGCIPILLAVLMVFFPDTPRWYLSKERKEDAKKSLIRFRGSQFNVDKELEIIQDNLNEEKRDQKSLTEAFTTKAAKKGLLLALSIMVFQQFSGINAVIFYASKIFTNAGVQLDPRISTCIVGGCQIVATYVSTLLIDRLGRRLLLILSGAFMAFAGIVLGVYFYLKNTGVDVTSLSFLPIVCLVVFIVMFSIGFGPIPWLYMGEVFSVQIKAPAMSIATVVNWLSVFIVTKFYSSLDVALHQYGPFWIFSAISIAGCFFVGFLLVETKGKSFEQIQAELSGEHYSKTNNGTVNAQDQSEEIVECVRY